MSGYFSSARVLGFLVGGICIALAAIARAAWRSAPSSVHDVRHRPVIRRALRLGGQLRAARDRVGRRRLLLTAIGLYAAALAGFAVGLDLLPVVLAVAGVVLQVAAPSYT